ncbi:phage tail protein [Alteraurantiacibacter buctensis]|uniref:Phage tail protein n=1 Tax=Alteraurantiacibacter buctensis TaxID=1503981 RepID=A0A844YWZ8_9SPHN|nr:phage tail protein [Alteraurantiacibacter buctensis]MXO72865.1 phage tail protein [Alteraurantiacibacter buctensis]
MAVSDWSSTASSNTTIDGVNIAEGCSPAGLNNAIRSIMAAVKAWATGSVTATGLTMTTARLLGRSTSGTGAIEEISIGSGLSMSGGTLSATAASTLTGEIKTWPTNSAPAGYLECSGAAVSRTTYSALFAVIGTTFGSGDGSTTFNLPNLRGEFVRGWDNGRGVDSGRAFGSAQSDELEAHTHTYSTPTTVGAGYPGGSGGGFGGGYSTGSTGGTETRPRNIALMYIIKT